MKSRLSVLTVLAAFPAIALAQSANVISTNSAAVQQEMRTTRLLPKGAAPGSRITEPAGRSAAADSASAWESWAPLKWDPPAAPRSRFTLAGNVVVSGPLVDTFRTDSRNEPGRSLGRRILDWPVINIFVPERLPKATRQGSYLAWGERDEPWTMLAERPRPGPQGVLLSFNY